MPLLSTADVDAQCKQVNSLYSIFTAEAKAVAGQRQDPGQPVRAAGGAPLRHQLEGKDAREGGQPGREPQHRLPYRRAAHTRLNFWVNEDEKQRIAVSPANAAMLLVREAATPHPYR